MSYQAFRRQPVPQQSAQILRALSIPAPTRGLITNENEAYMQPGGAIVQDNWVSTMRGVKVRGGSVLWNDLNVMYAPAWITSHAYAINDTAYDALDGSFWTAAVAHTSGTASSWMHNTFYARGDFAADGSFWKCLVPHTSITTGLFVDERNQHPDYWAAGTFKDDRTNFPTYWGALPIVRLPVISMFEYSSGTKRYMYAANQEKLFDVTQSSTPVLVKSGQASGNYCNSQLANQGGDYMMVVNDAGDFPLRYDGTAWTTLNADQITGPAGSTVLHGKNLTYVWKYRNRWFFIEGNSMNAWFLGTNAIQGVLQMIPLSGSASKGGKLLFGATWSLDAGDGIDDKCVFATDLGELLIFTGSDPSDPNNWSQQGRYQVGAPLGMNAHMSLGGDLLLMTVDGIVPISAAITKESAQLELAAITVTIKKTWRDEVAAHGNYPWTMKKWDEYGGIFVTTPGGPPGSRYCYVANNATGAWARLVGYDAMCFGRIRADMFFGTQDGFIMQADEGGTDNGAAYLCTLVGNWNMLQQQVSQSVWRQARATFRARQTAAFQMQLAGCTDFNVVLPASPMTGTDNVAQGQWDIGLWDQALWDAGETVLPARNTGWVSIGNTGYSHAPVVQVLIAQQLKPDIELISLDAVFEPAGVNV